MKTLFTFLIYISIFSLVGYVPDCGKTIPELVSKKEAESEDKTLAK